MERVDVIGVPISATNRDEVLASLKEDFGAYQGNYICVSNAHTCVMAHDNPDYWRVQAESAASIPDGKPLSVVGRKQFPGMGRVTGPDLMRDVFELSREMGWSHYFYGNTQENLDALLEALRAQYPGLDIRGAQPSVFRDLTEAEKDELVKTFNESGADFVWVALGAPRQEVFCHDLKGRVFGVMVGVGGAFNVLSGVVSDAPQWMKDHGLEWFYRFAQEPRRLFKRYLVTNSKFIVYQLFGIARRRG